MKNVIKKIILVFIIMMLIIISQVYADESCSIYLTTNNNSVNLGGTITISVIADNINLEDGLSALEGYIEYDSTVFEKIKKSDFSLGSSDWESVNFNSENKHFQIDTKINDDNEIITFKNKVTVFNITLKVLNDAKEGNTEIKLTNLLTAGKYSTINTENKDIPIQDAKMEITIKSEKPQDKPTDPTKPEDTEEPDNLSNPTNPTETKETQISTDSSTEKKGVLPKAGNRNIILLILLIVSIIIIALFVRYRKMKDI